MDLALYLIEKTEEEYIADIYYYRGHSKSYLTRYEEALSDFNKLIELREDDSEAFYFKALTEFYLGLYEEAINDFDISIELDSNASNAYYFRGLSKK
ncbi:tetratricopeptide repeat protein [Brachyspira hyodysenteriae]|nr:tetratricopeptide repeat protein [Brachyspira hyodysenteriae]MDA1469873.1 tetratricopeptide repeat protein [Brachyspira hyodysenteriae]